MLGKGGISVLQTSIFLFGFGVEIFKTVDSDAQEIKISTRIYKEIPVWGTKSCYYFFFEKRK